MGRRESQEAPATCTVPAGAGESACAEVVPLGRPPGWSPRARARRLGALALAVLTWGHPAGQAARPPRPQLTPAASAALGQGGLLLPGANTLVELASGRATTLFQPAPKRLVVLDGRPGVTLLVLDDDLVRVRVEGTQATLERLAEGVGREVAVSEDGSIALGLEDKRTIRLWSGGTSEKLSWRREGFYELSRPWLSPDGARGLVTVHEVGQSGIDRYSLLVIDVVKRDAEEVALSMTFAPGSLRQTVGPRQVLFELLTQQGERDGLVEHGGRELSLFDLETRTLKPAPASLRAGRAAPVGGRTIQLEGSVSSDTKRCGAMKTQLVEASGESRALGGPSGEPLSLLDFLSDGSGVVAASVDLRSCKARAFVVSLPGEKRRPLTLPQGGQVEGLLDGRVLPPAPAARAPVDATSR